MPVERVIAIYARENGQACLPAGAGGQHHRARAPATLRRRRLFGRMLARVALGMPRSAWRPSPAGSGRAPTAPPGSRPKPRADAGQVKAGQHLICGVSLLSEQHRFSSSWSAEQPPCKR